MKWTRGVLLILAVSFAGTALGGRDQNPPPGRGTPAPLTPPSQVPPPGMPPPGLLPPPMASTPSVDTLLLAALRVQDAKIADLEKRLAALEKKAGVSK